MQDMEELDEKVKQDMEEAFRFIRKYLPNGGNKKVASRIAKNRGIKFSSAYQHLMKVKSGKVKDSSTVVELLEEAKKNYIAVTKFVRKELKEVA